MKFLLYSLLAIFFLCCETPEKKSLLKFDDPLYTHIADLQDKRISDSLIQYFDNTNPLYRKEAVLAFGSVQDSSALDRIGRLLVLDHDAGVRKAAAFALGQIPNGHSERILLGAMVKEKNPEVIEEIFEAYGKTTKAWQLIQPDLLKDSSRTSGIAWSLYRAGLRGKTDSIANRVAENLLSTRHNYLTRLGAAHYFARAAKNYDFAQDAIIASAQNDPSAEVRMAATTALRKIMTDSSSNALRKIALEDQDYRVRVNAVRGLQSFPFKDVKRDLYQALRDKNVNVGIASSEVIRSLITPNDWTEVASLTSLIQQWRIQANLYEAALAASENPSLIQEIKTIYASSKNPYQKAALLTALQSSQNAFAFISNEFFKADTFILKTAAASAITGMNRANSFKPQSKTKFAEFYKKAIQDGDAAVIGLVAGTIGDSTLAYRNVIKDFTFLYDAKNTLSLPKDNEALQPLEVAIAYFEKKKIAVPVENEFNHPIDFNILRSLSKDQLAVIKTTKGHVVIKLLADEAPGSVANFIDLVRKNYFDQKFFHRVVPNFVIQGGCNRGDGWGSEDYSIRSEFTPRRYKTGSVGMASAGKDTEGTQWFITHSPTPHLDGRYTIFAEVVDGMTAVHNIEIGDQILDIELKSDIQQ